MIFVLGTALMLIAVMPFAFVASKSTLKWVQVVGSFCLSWFAGMGLAAIVLKFIGD